MDYYIGIDIGTSAAKLIAINESGDVVYRCEREYQYSEPEPGWREIWPAVWLDAVRSGLGELLLNLNRAAVKSIGFTGQMHTTVFLDQQGQTIRPAIMWNDMRTKDYIPTMKRMLTQEDTVGILKIISTGSPAVNLLWLKGNEEDHFNKLGKFLIGPDYLVYFFSGQYSTDYCEASTSSLYDPDKRGWSASMQKLIGLSDSVYPPVRGSREIVGTLRAELQSEFGLPANVRIIAGTGDNPAAAVATGCLRYRYPVLSMGTSGILVLTRDEMPKNSKGKGILFSLDGRQIHNLVQGAVQSAGGSFGWYVKKILQMDDFDDLTKNVDRSTLGEGELLFYPHLTGDKTIYADPSVRGAFIGLNPNHTREDLAVAVMEGVCFAVKQLSQAMRLSQEEMTSLKVTGGGANSYIWMQILADVLDTEIEQLDSGEGASYGVAIMARDAVCMNELADGIQNEVKIKNRISPRTRQADLYFYKYNQYLKIYDALKTIYQ